MRQLEGKIRKAIEAYSLIDDGDVIGVGISGGKDSLALLCGLAALRKYYPKSFRLVALTLDPCFQNKETDFSKITALCEELGVPHIIKRTNLFEIIFEIRKEKNPCSLCARMRRGALHDLCVENGCNKIALGHNMDDVVETFFMNLFNEGRISALAPKSYPPRKNLTMIRPLVFCGEGEVANAVRRSALPVVKSTCPMDGHSERQRLYDFITQKGKEYPGFLRRTFTALQGGNISGLGVYEPKED